MKTLLWVLGGLFLLSKLRAGGLTAVGTLTAATGSPFGSTPAGGGAGIIIPPSADPYGNLLTGPGGGGGGIAGIPYVGPTGSATSGSVGFHTPFLVHTQDVAGPSGPVRSGGFTVASATSAPSGSSGPIRTPTKYTVA
jgi:hypothetical protein